MLARLLRWTYLVQLLVGGWIGLWCARQLPAPNEATTLTGMLLGGVLWVVFWQAVVIGNSMRQSRPPRPLAPWLKAAWGELMAALLIFCLRLPWTGGTPTLLPPTRTDQARLPVLLVHGFICNHRIWDKVADRLRAQGHSVLTLDLEPLFTSIDNYCPQIEQAVSRLCQHTGSAHVVLVGHSMGGLAIRAWIRTHGDSRVAKVLTMGTPHQGTQTQQWVHTANGLQMAWHSPWLAELARSETPATRQRMHLALTQHDNIVHPQREQILEGAQVTEFSGVGHLQMCLDDAVIEWVLREAAGLMPPKI